MINQTHRDAATAYVRAVLDVMLDRAIAHRSGGKPDPLPLSLAIQAMNSFYAATADLDMADALTVLADAQRIA